MKGPFASVLTFSILICTLTACITAETKPPKNPVLAQWASQWGFEPWLMNGKEVYCRSQAYSGREAVFVPPLDCDRARTMERLMRSDRPPSYVGFPEDGFW
jgi:hypothetical protein